MENVANFDAVAMLFKSKLEIVFKKFLQNTRNTDD